MAPIRTKIIKFAESVRRADENEKRRPRASFFSAGSGLPVAVGGSGVEVAEVRDVGDRVLVAAHPDVAPVVGPQLHHAEGHLGVGAQHPPRIGGADEEIRVVDRALRRLPRPGAAWRRRSEERRVGKECAA